MSKDIIFIGGIDWYGKYKYSTHHIVEKLSTHNRVFYIDNFGGRRDLRVGDISRIFRRITAPFKKNSVYRRKADPNHDNIAVIQPALIPTPRFPRVIGSLNSAFLERKLDRVVRGFEVREPVVWTCVPTDVVWNSISRLPRRILVYQSVDNFACHPLIPKSVRARFLDYERLFTRSADLVFTSGRKLFEEKKGLNPNTHFFPNGVDQDQFGEGGEPLDILNYVQHPVIGFAGLLGPWVDYDLLDECVSKKPEWSFVFLGSIVPGTHLRGLTKHPNAHFAGAVDHSELGVQLRYFDVGIIPYKITEFTQYTFPSKMAEYLTVGLPVVSTALPEVQPYSDVVGIIHNAQEMIEAIQQALDAPDKSERIESRLKVAQSLSWKTIVSGMERLIDEAIRVKI